MINGKPAAEFYKAVEDYQAAAKRPLAFEAAGFDQWVKETSALTAEEQVKAVAKKLQELNPGFDGKVVGGVWGVDNPVIENGVVKTFGIFTDHVTDISPLRALEGLSVLDLHGTATGKGQLVNISPLKGLPLTELQIYSTQVSDLSPLRGMKLTYLHCGDTFVSDLSPLNGMKLDGLDCGGTKVHDISVLKGMPLTDLRIHPDYNLRPLAIAGNEAETALERISSHRRVAAQRHAAQRAWRLLPRTTRRTASLF